MKLGEFVYRLVAVAGLRVKELKEVVMCSQL